MKISELITKLQKSLEKYGDLEVVDQCEDEYGFESFDDPVQIIKSTKFEKETLELGDKMCYVGFCVPPKGSKIIDKI